MKRTWFKHFGSASSGASLRALWDSGDYEGYGFFWRLLEFMCQFEDKKNPGSMTIHWATLRREIGWTVPKLRHVAERVCLRTGIELRSSSDNLATFVIPKWLELQSSWGGKRGARSDQDAGRSKRLEVRSKRLEVRGKKTETKTPSPPPLVDIWNQNRGQLPEARGCSRSRAGHATARWQENPDPEYWSKIVRIVAASAFCRGQNQRGWRADFDFLVMPDTHLKALEGKYDDRVPLNPAEEQERRRKELQKKLAEERAQMQQTEGPEIAPWNP